MSEPSKKPSKVVITGATGHLGRAVVAALAGPSVIAVSRSGATVGHAPGLSCDVSEESSVAILRGVLGPDVVLVHLAAWHPPATASTTPEDRRRLLDTNVLGTMRVLDAARGGNVARVVYASTFEVYGAPGEGAIDETHRTYPRTDYGATKLAGEHHLAAFAYEEGGVPTVSLRMPAIYGPGERTPRALPNFLAQVAMGERPVVFGDGEDLRDQLHVDDAARAVLCALERGEGVYQVADGQPHSILEIAQTAMRVAGIDGEPERQERVKERRDFHMDITKARAELGFEPQVTLEDGMREQLGWIRMGSD
ncbi:MAG: NAD-dependent epimerase/dehydratase family protein [Sandaracinaceae bacterium]|nr:NAD-dependent epimerase/dehydratase family protein [Sandaracinaceae bacterium]